MSPSRTPQGSDFSQQRSRQQHEGDRMDIDADESLFDFDANARLLTAEELAAIAPEDRIDFSDEDEDETIPSVTLPASADPNQPLSASPAMDAALSEISSGAPESRTGRNERRPAGVGPAQMLREKVEAQRQVDAARQAEAEKAAASSRTAGPRPEKRNRPISVSSPTGSGKKAKSDNPAPDASAMDTTEEKRAKNRPKSFGHIDRPSRLKCAVMIGTNEIMGDPFSQTPGWDLKVALDPGKLGQPSIGLEFKFSKDGTDSKQQDHYNTFALGWEPGVQIEGKWMMEDLVVEVATEPSDPELLAFTYPAAIKKLCKSPEDAARLICLAFRSNAHKSSPREEKWTMALQGNDWVAPYNNLHSMYSAEDPGYIFAVWFMNPYTSHERFTNSCAKPLLGAVEDHTPPFHQYLNEHDEPMTNFDLESEHEEALEATETEPILTTEDADALRAENLKLKTENDSLQTLIRGQNKKIRELADDLRQSYKKRDEIIQVAEKMKHQRELKPKQIQKALNAMSKILE